MAMEELLKDRAWKPNWDVGIATIKNGEHYDLVAGSAYEILSGEGEARLGTQASNNSTFWAKDTRPVNANLRRITPAPTTVIRVTATSSLLGIIREPLKKTGTR